MDRGVKIVTVNKVDLMFQPCVQQVIIINMIIKQYSYES